MGFKSVGFLSIAVCGVVSFAGAAVGQTQRLTAGPSVQVAIADRQPTNAPAIQLPDGSGDSPQVAGALAATAIRLRSLQQGNGTWNTRLTFDDAYGAMTIVALNYLEVPGVQADHEVLAGRYIARMHVNGGFSLTPGDPPSKGGTSLILLALSSIRDRGVSDGFRAYLDAAIARAEHFIAHARAHPEVESPLLTRLSDLMWDTIYPERSDRTGNWPLHAPLALGFVSLGGPKALGAPLLSHSEPVNGLLAAQQSQAQNAGARWADGLLGGAGARRALEKKILDAQEPNGAWWYSTISTALNVIALKRQGHKVEGPVIGPAVAYLLASRRYENGILIEDHNQSDLWDTAQFALRLRHATGRQLDDLESRVIPEILAASVDGSYSFSLGGRIPDNDDTAIALALLSGSVHGISGDLRKSVIARIRASTARLVEEQQWDGGFATWGGPVGVSFGDQTPDSTNSVVFDAAAPGITSRILIALSAAERSGVLSAELAEKARRAQVSGMYYLRNSASGNGTWWSRWVMGRLFAFESVPTWMRSRGVTARDPLFRGGRKFLLDHQNPDGGWGETAAADRDIRAAGRGRSTPAQTAVAVIGLIAMTDEGDSVARRSIDRGVAYILSSGTNGDWSSGLPMATAITGLMYYEAPEWENLGVLSALRVYQDYVSVGPRAAVDRYVLGEAARVGAIASSTSRAHP